MNEREFNRLLKRVCYDKEAFVRLYRFYYPRIILYIAKECPEADAEAVGQEFFIRLIKIVNPAHVRYPTSWVFTACRNLVKDMTEGPEEIVLSEELSAAEELYYPDTEDDVEMSERVEGLLDELDGITRKIIIMYYWKGYTFREIARKMDMKEVTVRKRHSRAIKKIRDLHTGAAKEGEKDVLLTEVRKWNTNL
mgnify:FL=1